MFAQDLVASLAAIRGLLRPGGSLGAIVWGPPERAEVQSLTNRVLMQSLGLPAVNTGKGTPFGLCDREALERNFGAAGFTNIESQTVSVVYDFSSAEEYVQYRRERSSLKNNRSLPRGSAQTCLGRRRSGPQTCGQIVPSAL